MENNDLIITRCVKIEKKELELVGATKDYIDDKIFDGSAKGYWISTEQISLKNIVASDDVSINFENLILTFDNEKVGENKTVKINTSNVLIGSAANNYFVEEKLIKGKTIYPYSLTANVNGVGSVEIINKRGLTERDKISLIPIGAVLVVEPILFEDVNYVKLYRKISKYLSGNTEFAIGYKISMIVDGEKVEIDNNLYLSLPYIKDISGAYYLTGDKSGEIDFQKNNKRTVVDLKQIEFEINTIFFTQPKVLLKPWQIVLIVVTGVAVITAGVLVFIIIRKRKFKEYGEQEKI